MASSPAPGYHHCEVSPLPPVPGVPKGGQLSPAPPATDRPAREREGEQPPTP